ncbi:hypothetical protein JCM8547_002332 [Rhodosporidiobolus lusitaniae]
MLLPPELIAVILGHLASGPLTPARRHRLLRLSTASRLFSALVEHVLLRRALVDSDKALRWLEKRTGKEEKRDVIIEAAVVFSAGEEMLDRTKLLTLLAELPRLHRFSIEYKPTRYAWERLKVESALLERVNWAALTHLHLTNTSLDFPSPSLPILLSLLSLSLTESRLTLSPPSSSPSYTGALLPLSSFPSLTTLAVRDAREIDHVRLPYVRPAVYLPRHFLPFLRDEAPKLREIVLDPLLLQRIHRRELKHLLEELEKAAEGEKGVKVVWEFGVDVSPSEAQSALLEWTIRTRIEHLRLGRAVYVEIFLGLVASPAEGQQFARLKSVTVEGETLDRTMWEAVRWLGEKKGFEVHCEVKEEE